TSVTPLSLPARTRALHAALVILVRHGAGLSDNAAAMRFDPSAPEVAKALQFLRLTLKSADPRESQAANIELDAIVEEWTNRVVDAGDAGRTLYYLSGTRQIPSLLKNFGASGDGWETPQSMRSVDRQCWLD